MGGLAWRERKAGKRETLPWLCFHTLAFCIDLVDTNNNIKKSFVCTARTYFTLILFCPSKKIFIVSFFHLAGFHAHSVASHQRLHSREQAVVQTWEQYFLGCQQLFCSVTLL